jgi:hypothetical protein
MSITLFPWHLADDATVWAETPEGPQVIAKCGDLDDDAFAIALVPKMYGIIQDLSLKACLDWNVNNRACRTCIVCRAREIIFQIRITGGTP